VKVQGREFGEVWLVDFEYQSLPGERPVPTCMVAVEVGTGRTLRLWQDELRWLRSAPFNVGPDSLFVAYYASAELGCFYELGWSPPVNILDLFVEFRNLLNGHKLELGFGILGALAYFNMPALDAIEKKEMRELAIRGGPFTDQERRALLEYCQTDVVALAKLLPAMERHLDMPRAIVRYPDRFGGERGADCAATARDPAPV
jgi:hypothetical protein